MFQLDDNIIFDSKLGELNLLQLVKFDTWSRQVGLVLRSSLLDHVYVNNVDLIKNITHSKPCFGDHELIIAQCCITRPLPKITQRRDWRHYSKDNLCEKLSTVDWSSNASSVQESWNDLEYKIINIVDELIPNVDFHGDHLAHKPCPTVKRKLNLRNRLLKSLKKGQLWI